MSGRVVLASCAVLALLFLFSLLSVDGVAPTGEARLCSWSSVALDARWSPVASSRVNGAFCEGQAGGFRFSYRLIAITKKDAVINLGAVRHGYSRMTGAGETPTTELSFGALMSLPRLLWGNRLPLIVYMAPNKKQGYTVTEITEKVALVGAWASDTPVTATTVADELRIRLNAKAPWYSRLWIKLMHLAGLILMVPPLFSVLGGRAIYRAADQWKDVTTPSGLVLYVVGVPAVLFGYGWFCFKLLGWSTAFALALMLLMAAAIVVATNIVRDRQGKLTLRIFNPEKLPVLTTYRSSETTLDVLGADVSMGREMRLEMWLPRRIQCPGCSLSYPVYVPSSASELLSRPFGVGETVPAEQQQRLAMAAVKAAPQAMNGCIRCGASVTGNGVAISATDESIINPVFAVSAAAALAVAVFLLTKGDAVVDFLEDIPLVGWLLGYLADEASELMISLLMLPILILIGTFIAKASTRSALNQKGLRRIYACEKEGMIFEDMDGVHSSLDCPSCNGAMEPLWRFKLAEAS